jgi:hypothetical protein
MSTSGKYITAGRNITTRNGTTTYYSPHCWRYAHAMNPHDGALSARIVRVHSVVDGRRTSVSLDELLVELVMKRLGGSEQIVMWATGAAERAVRQPQSCPASRRQRIGLSRLVQCEAIRLVAREGLL